MILFIDSAGFNRSRELNPPDYTIWDNWVFENFMLADESFPKALQIFETCVPLNNKLCVKLVLSLKSPTTFYERYKALAVPFFIPNFNLLRW